MHKHTHTKEEKKQHVDPVQYSWVKEKPFRKQMAISLKTAMCEPLIAKVDARVRAPRK